MPTPEVLKNFIRAVKPDGEVIGFVRAPLYFPSGALKRFRVFPPEEVREDECWWAGDLTNALYDMVRPFYDNSPMVTFEVRRTSDGKQYFRPNTLFFALRRNIVLFS